MPVDHFFDAAILVAIGLTLIIQSKLGHVMAKQQQAVDAVVAQLVKSREEILGAQRGLFEKIADVQAQLDSAHVESVDLSALTAVAQSLDDIVPDPVEETVVEPVEETVVDSVDPVVEPVDPVVEPVVDETVVEPVVVDVPVDEPPVS